MIAFFSFILAIVGCLNWLSIGMLQFDFVAGIFGTQSSILSRIIYVIVGIAAIMLIVEAIKTKGKLHLTLKKSENSMANQPLPATESAEDVSKDKK